LSAHHLLGHCICVTLVRVAGLADAAQQLHPIALLDDVRGLVRGGMEVGCPGECEVFPACEGLRTHDHGPLSRALVHVGLDGADIVATEQSLDGGARWQITGRPAHAMICGGVDLVAGGGWSAQSSDARCTGRREISVCFPGTSSACLR
jgi:hypothetical protein